MKRLKATTQDALRDGILASGHGDFVSMADVQACIFGGLLLDMSTRHQQMVVNTIHSMLNDGLITVGDIPGRDDPDFKPWPGTPDEVMAQFVNRFVNHHDDPHGWEYTIWLNLTESGQRASNAIVGYPPR